jgi:hypothetical protein
VNRNAATYNHWRFETRLHARYAAFFDLAGWTWTYRPPPVNFAPVTNVIWWPTFRVRFPCGHSECNDYHELLAEVQPFATIEQFDGHPCLACANGCVMYSGTRIDADAGAAFGIDPNVSQWDMLHGAGGGRDAIFGWVRDNVNDLWLRAERLVKT